MSVVFSLIFSASRDSSNFLSLSSSFSVSSEDLFSGLIRAIIFFRFTPEGIFFKNDISLTGFNFNLSELFIRVSFFDDAGFTESGGLGAAMSFALSSSSDVSNAGSPLNESPSPSPVPAAATGGAAPDGAATASSPSLSNLGLGATGGREGARSTGGPAPYPPLSRSFRKAAPTTKGSKLLKFKLLKFK